VPVNGVVLVAEDAVLGSDCSWSGAQSGAVAPVEVLLLIVLLLMAQPAFQSRQRPAGGVVLIEQAAVGNSVVPEHRIAAPLAPPAVAIALLEMNRVADMLVTE